MPAAFTYTASPSGSFFTNVTEITLADTSVLDNPLVFRNWDFGDFTFASASAVTHIWTQPGIYDIKLTITDNSGTTYATTSSINIENYIFDAVKFSAIPPPSEQGEKQVYSFKILLSATNTETHVIDLYSQFSRSAPLLIPGREPNRWRGLQPYWRFTDVDDNPITTITTTDNIVYYNSTVVGVTGEAEFYYIDDIPTEDPLILWATLRTSDTNFQFDNQLGDFPSYANSKVRAGLPYHIDAVVPDSLYITEDVNANIHPIKWTGGTIPHLITVRGKSVYNGVAQYPIIYNFPPAGTTTSNLQRTILGYPPSAFNFDATQQTFIRNSAEGFDTGGYIKSNVNLSPLMTGTSSTQISATIDVTGIGSIRRTPFIWIPNPMNTSISKISLGNPLPSEVVDALENTTVPLLSSVTITTVPALTAADEGVLDTIGYSGLYGVAVDPTFNAWVTDSELDRVYKFNSLGTIVSTIQLSAQSSPVSICLDSTLNMYVACIGDEHVLKLGPAGNVLNTITVPDDIPALSGAVLSDDDTEGTIIPTIVETDKEDNLWVGYAHEDFNTLVTFDLSGNYIQHIIFDETTGPGDMLVDTIDDAIWVSLAHNSYGYGGMINKYSLDATLLSSFSADDPYYITQDLYGGIWATIAFNQVQHINPNGSIDYFEVGDGAPTWFDVSANPDTTALEGIACDAENRIWILDTIDNRAHIISQEVDQITNSSFNYTFDSIKILPDANLEYYIDENNEQYTESNTKNSSIQALGDWTGLRWHKKYMPSRLGGTATIEKTINGLSSPFSILDYTNPYDIRRHDESFDVIEYLKGLPMPERLAQNNILFDQFLTNMIGGQETNDQSIGRLMYEKIANFPQNHIDVDTCGISQLYAIAEQLDVPIDNYNLTFPPELKRLMDVLSISHCKLWGARSKNQDKFKDNFTCCTDCKPVNRGTKLDFYTSSVSAGTSIVLKDKFSDTYLRAPVFALSAMETFPLSSYTNEELVQPLQTNYEFFTYIPTYDHKQVEGVINWGDERTTLSENSSAIDSWYGDINELGDEGIIEVILNYALHRGLGLVSQD